MNFTGSTKKLILVHEGMAPQTLDETVDVMLTPQFYTLKRESLPVKYAYQAKKIAPSLFDGLLDESESYAYDVHKCDEGWEFIAYDLDKIKYFLRTKGIVPEKVGKLFFAQQAADKITAPVALGESQALVNLNGIVTVVPKSVLDETTQFANPDSTWRPKRGISLGGSEGSLLTGRQAFSLAAVLVLFAAGWFIEGSRYGGDLHKEQEKISALLEAYPALQSSYTRKSVAEKYQTLDRQERKKRDIIKALSKMIFKGVTLSSLKMDEKAFQAEFSAADKSVAQKLQALAKKEKFNTTDIKGSSEIRIEGQL